MIHAIYSNLCPICHEDLSTEEIEEGKCAHRNKKLEKAFENREAEQFFQFFSSRIGKPRALQRLWAKRIFNKESFAAIAPTGIGKSTFGIAMAAFLAKRGKKSYLIFPTTLLVEQAVEKLGSMGEDVARDAIYYHRRINKEEFFDRLLNKNFKILITTNQFLAKNFDKLSNITFDFIFVDDVDAILKASRNIDRILRLLGFYFDGTWKGKAKGVLMVSTATAKKGRKANLFRQLLNFDIGSSRLAIRNIVDVYYEGSIKSLLSKIGRGGIIYARSIEEAEKWHEELKEFKVGLVTSKNKEAFELFKDGKLNFLIGTAYYYGVLTRGIDLPEEIKYAIFIGAPVTKIRIDGIDELPPSMIKFIASALREDEEIKKFIPFLQTIEKRKEFEDLKKAIKEAIKRVKPKDFVIRENEIIFPDIRTYIQGSGRTSRLTTGGITKGASFLIEDDKEVASAFIERASYFDIEFKSMEEIDFEKLQKEVEESRKKRRKYEDLIKPTLFIVESPTKAKQIARFFGKPSARYGDVVAYEVAGENRIIAITASLGHITDLITNKGFHGVLVNKKFIPIYASIKKCMDCNYQFTEERESCPKCGSKNINDAKKRIDALRKLAYEVEEIIVATDPDAEGEKIAWDLKNMLSFKPVKRAEFHEITRAAIKKALDELRNIDENMVKAQIVRRIEDRWIGFVLSEKLWNVFSERNLSAGRAQTPVLGWIIERADENRQRIKVGFVKEFGLVLKNVGKSEIELEIELMEERREKKNPLPPYTTDSMLRDANAILKMNANETMKIAQALFENGLITYHRTDSTRVSEAGFKIAREYLKENFVERWSSGEGAHECIRPTHAWDRNLVARLIREGVIYAEDIERKHLALYDLIFRRFMASLAPPYDAVVRTYRIKYDGNEAVEERVVGARGLAYELYRSVAVKKELPSGKFRVRAEIREVPKAPLYTQSDIVSKMKEHGIGRPSTYATIIEKLFIRGYIIEKNGKILPTKKGIKVFEYLNSNYHDFVSEERTKLLYEEMDKVESGKVDYYEVLNNVYNEIRRIA